jgi:hypothetical protein
MKPVNNVPLISPPTAALEGLVDVVGLGLGLGGGLVAAAADGADDVDEFARDVMEYESEVL